jgi:hypothetical protein
MPQPEGLLLSRKGFSWAAIGCNSHEKDPSTGFRIQSGDIVGTNYAPVPIVVDCFVYQFRYIKRDEDLASSWVTAGEIIEEV